MANAGPIGNQLKEACERLSAQCPGTTGPLQYPPHGVRSTTGENGKLQHEITVQIEKYRSQCITKRYDRLPKNDRRRQAFESRQPTTMAALTTTPSHESQVPQNLYIGVATHILGALDPRLGWLCNKIRLVVFRLWKTQRRPHFSSRLI